MEKKTFWERPAIHQFLFRFFLIFIASQLFLEFVSIRPLQEFITQLVSSLVNVPADGILLSIGTGSFQITPFCTGITSAALFLGLVFGFSYPRMGEKIKLGALGMAILFFLNIFRVAGIVYVGKITQNLALADALHTLTWFAMSGLVLGGWYYGMLRFTRTKDGNALARKLLVEKK